MSDEEVRDDDLKRYSDAAWQAHSARFRSSANWKEPVPTFGHGWRPHEDDGPGSLVHEEIAWSSAGMTRILYVRRPDGSLHMDFVGRLWPFACMRTWEFRLPDWEIEEGMSGRRVVWMERHAQEGPCDVTVGYRRAERTEYVDLAAGVFLPPPPPEETDWHETYGPELVEFASLAYTLEAGLPRVYLRARLSPSERTALEHWLGGESIRSIAGLMSQRGGSGRKRVEEWISAALKAVMEAFRVDGPPLGVSFNGPSSAGGSRRRGGIPASVGSGQGVGRS